MQLFLMSFEKKKDVLFILFKTTGVCNHLIENSVLKQNKKEMLKLIRVEQFRVEEKNLLFLEKREINKFSVIINKKDIDKNFILIAI